LGFIRAGPETALCGSLYLPLPRLIIDDADLSRPIPALSERQFVVDNDLGTDEEKKSKALFWYKQEFLSRITAAWAEVRRACDCGPSHGT
jgi:hypothetical protein